jgi:hypothetical protein
MLAFLWAYILAATPASPVDFDPAAHVTVFVAHGEGAQIYECKAGASGSLVWTFREPIASLIVDGKTVGHHYAGPHWALADGSSIQGKVSATVPGATPTDIPQLKLDVIAHQGTGALDQATLVYRVRTQGGTLSGLCSHAGALRSVSYSADYLFEK